MESDRPHPKLLADKISEKKSNKLRDHLLKFWKSTRAESPHLHPVREFMSLCSLRRTEVTTVSYYSASTTSRYSLVFVSFKNVGKDLSSLESLTVKMQHHTLGLGKFLFVSMDATYVADLL